MTGSILKWFAVAILAAVLQTTLVPVIGVMGVQPDLLMILLFAFAIQYGVVPGIYVGFFLGLAQDLYTPAILGQHALAKTVIGAFAGLFNERIMRTDPLIKLVLLAIAFLLHDTLFGLVQAAKTDYPFSSLAPELLTRTLPRTVYSTAVAAILYLWSYLVRPAMVR